MRVWTQALDNKTGFLLHTTRILYVLYDDPAGVVVRPATRYNYQRPISGVGPTKDIENSLNIVTVHTILFVQCHVTYNIVRVYVLHCSFYKIVRLMDDIVLVHPGYDVVYDTVYPNFYNVCLVTRQCPASGLCFK
jgi:hypothetical protein